MKRKAWIDFAKFIAMLLVTWEHTSQSLSGETFTNILGGGGKIAAFHMPLFFILSGYVIYIYKLQEASLFYTLKQKGLRLFVPAIAWAVLRCIITLHPVMPWILVSIYWYLTDLFLCYLIIALVTKLCRANIILTALLCMFIVLLIPKMPAFMMPFLWIGILLRRYEHFLLNTWLFVASILCAGYIFTFWDWHYTFYLTPYNILAPSFEMYSIYIIRFVMGLCCSYIVLFICKKFESSYVVQKLSYMGTYTLAVYTFSLLLQAIASKCITIHMTTPILLDTCSLIVACVVYYLSILVHRLLKKNQYLSLLFLGE